jgi:ferredoxin-NADP reductase
MQKWFAKLLAKTHVAEETIEFSFEKPEKFTFTAGQYILLQLPELQQADPKGPVRTFTISSAPHEKTINITTRHTGSGFKTTLAEMSTNSAVEIMGPQGDFVYKMSEKEAVFIAGGIGITPFFSIIKNFYNEQFHPLTLIYSNRTQASTAYHDFFLSLQKKEPGFKYIPTFVEASQQWHGEKRLVNDSFIRDYIAEINKKEVYLCGPPGMVDALKNLFKKLAIPEEQVYFESFFGY